MTVANTIQFTTQQARSVADVSPEAWRHWRKNLPYFAKNKGKAAKFSMGEVVALCAVKDIVGIFGIRVAMLSGGLDQIFRISAPMSLLFLQDCSFVVTATSGEIIKVDQIRDLPSAAIVIRCENFVDHILKVAFQSSDEVYQKNLPFPPAAVARGSA
ncbi:MAG: hypothetical protein COC17_02765 [Hyphomicrobiales bacterium]|nr:MAG: hypothetical protein COC17_02765 [Hyphomicrobiales bacterium]